MHLTFTEDISLASTFFFVSESDFWLAGEFYKLHNQRVNAWCLL